MLIRTFGFALCVALSSTPFRPAAADSPQLRHPSSEEIVERLTPKLPKGVVVEEGEPPAPESASIDMEVNFEYNSVQLTTDAQLSLDQLGRALDAEALRASRFRITGHTDAVGSQAYNLDLSLRRARSVRDYLVRRHRIDARRLDVEGKGFTELADQAHPASAINRRVQVTNLGS